MGLVDAVKPIHHVHDVGLKLVQVNNKNPKVVYIEIIFKYQLTLKDQNTYYIHLFAGLDHPDHFSGSTPAFFFFTYLCPLSLSIMISICL